MGCLTIRAICGLAMAFLLIAKTSSAAAVEQTIASSGDALAIMSELVSINTSPQLGTKEAVDALRARFLKAGFPEADVSVLVNPADLQRPNLVVRLRGEGREKPLLYIAHLDVVTAKLEDWTVPPFKVTEQAGWLYGRGVLDMKGEVANVAAAMIRLRNEGFSPPGDIIAIFSPDEETRGPMGVAWLVKAHPELFKAKLILNPDAPVAIFREGHRAYYGVQTSEKIYATFLVEVTNRGGHSSEPRRDNAIYTLAAGLNRLAAFRFPIHLTQTVRAYYAAQARFATQQRKIDMVAVGNGDMAAAERLSEEPSDNAQVRTTCVTTMLSAGHAENALPQRATATIQCRLVPGEDIQSVEAQLTSVLGNPDIHIRLRYADPPTEESQPSTMIMHTFGQAVNALWPGLPIVPVMDAGGSDSLYTRTLGIPTFGAPSIFVDFDDVRAHGRDERIRSDRFSEGTELAYQMMKAFAQMRE